MRLLAEGKIDAYLGFPPEPQALRAKGIGRVVVNSAVDRPWSQYFCCMLVGNREFVRRHPVATKRALRAILKAADLCAAQPERGRAVHRRGGRGEELRLRSPGHQGIAVRQVARVRPGGHVALLRAPPEGGGNDQEQSTKNHHPECGLALPQRAEEGVEGMITRRALRSGLALAGGGGLLGLTSRPAAAEPPPETTRVRLVQIAGICVAPQYVAEELLRAEGFVDVQYVQC